MNATDWRKIALGVLAIAWGAVVSMAYHVVHKPVVSSQIAPLARSILVLVAWMATMVAVYGIGKFLTPGLSEWPQRERWALRTGLGLGALSLLMLGLGFMQGYWSWIAWALLAVFFLTAVRPFVSDIRQVLPAIPVTRLQKILAVWVTGILLLTFLRALAPPTAWDSLVYHLTGPRLYLEAHRIHHDVDLPYLGFPQAGSMLFLWGMLLAGPELAQLIHFSFLILTLALIPGLVNRIAPGRGWLGAALCLSVPTAVLLGAWAYVEWIVMYAGLAGFACLWRLRHEGGDWRLAAYAGSFAGLALSTKYSALGLVVGLIILSLLWLQTHKYRLVFLASAAGVVAPYLLKNWIMVGNPTYPFLFFGKYWDSFRAVWYARAGTGMDWLQLLLAPWDATVWGIEGGVVSGHPSYGATIGPLLLVLLPLAGLAWRAAVGEARRLLAGLMLVCVIAYGVWIGQLAYSALLVQSRLLLPILPLLAVLTTAGFDTLGRLTTRALAPRVVIGGLIGTVLAFGSLDSLVALATASPLPVVVGAQSQREFLVNRLGAYRLAMDAVNELPAGSRVVFLWEPRSYYCEAHVACEPDAILDRWWHLRRVVGAPQAIVANWHAADVTHVLIYSPKSQSGEHIVRAEGFDPFTAGDWDALDDLVSAHLIPVADINGVYALYRLN